jgi:hypothetical protein
MDKRIGATIDKLAAEEMKNEPSLAYERLNGNGRKSVNHNGEGTALASYSPFKRKKVQE